MGVQSNPVNVILDDLSQYLFNKYKYMSISTGTNVIADDAINLDSPVEINNDGFNKVRETTQGTLNNNNFSMLFELGPSEPLTQPLSIGQVGLMSQLATGGLGVGAKFTPVQTKDNTVRLRFRFSGSIKRIGDI